MAINLAWEVAPGALTDNLGTTLVVVIDDGSPCAAQLHKHARAARPVGVLGVFHCYYKWVMLLLSAVARWCGHRRRI